MTSDEKDKVPNQFRPQKATIAMFLASFVLLGFICWKAVDTADNARQYARTDLQEANIKIVELQQQLNCTINLIVEANRGMLSNSILQNDLLLTSTSGGERTEIEQQLKETRQLLISISENISHLTEECTK